MLNVSCPDTSFRGCCERQLRAGRAAGRLGLQHGAPGDLAHTQRPRALGGDRGVLGAAGGRHLAHAVAAPGLLPVRDGAEPAGLPAGRLLAQHGLRRAAAGPAGRRHPLLALRRPGGGHQRLHERRQRGDAGAGPRPLPVAGARAQLPTAGHIGRRQETRQDGGRLRRAARRHLYRGSSVLWLRERRAEELSAAQLAADARVPLCCRLHGLFQYLPGCRHYHLQRLRHVLRLEAEEEAGSSPVPGPGAGPAQSALHHECCPPPHAHIRLHVQAGLPVPGVLAALQAGHCALLPGSTLVRKPDPCARPDPNDVLHPGRMDVLFQQRAPRCRQSYVQNQKLW
ncbi:hypothetical protein FJT64_021695 [Amphibalanus amphitrite]|uniref:Uncharacterized protein n=1 Tax=Amphibalanus amphitrite TaxID=1232801 RepID=A0A6A4WST6_AMPAM|nr:hypothetical protein FJT64_021695 [Amphibalanus amphitrite]